VSELSNNDRTRLLELLGSELEAFGQIRKLTESQAKLLLKDNISAFDDSLDKGQEYIEKINGLHQESGPLMQSYMSAVIDNDESKDEEIERLLENIREVTAECAEFNLKNTDAAKTKIDEYIKKMEKLSSSRKGIGGYAQSVPNTPEMFDKLS